ncbi:uncharacterized protein LOC114250462 [Bombyx mandarina]|uniref:Protein sleepless n=2 Tax=Bombyx TaxID=7090 RepID=A0A8R2AU50_BOMMO|nr:uncharacterized protein LOC101743136 [Bombyx mori]XP_028040146.1 uncharacterized protein LOC114250462 [Bombyx mandarina]
MAKLSFLVPVLLLALFVKDSEPVNCWACSSNVNPLCNDPFNIRIDTGNSYLFRLENCDKNAGATFPYLTASKSVCKKEKKYIDGELVVSRGCTWKRQDDFEVGCPTSRNEANEVNLFCQTCDYDGCNGAATIGRTIALLLAPLSLLLLK